MADDTLGHKIKRLWPDKYKDDTPDDINVRISEALADDTKRPVVLQKLRRDFPGMKDLDDATLAERTLAKTSPRVDDQEPPAPTAPEQMKNREQGARLKKAAGAYKTIRKLSAANQSMEAQGRQAPSEAVSDAIESAAVEAPPPSSLKTAGGRETTRYPVIDDFREMEARAKAEGLELIMPGHGLGLQVVAVEPKSRKIRYALDEMASYAPAKIRGASAVGYLTGTSDPLQQGVANTIADMTGVARSSSLGDRGHSGLQIPGVAEDPRSGYGLPELGGDVGENLETKRAGAARALGVDPNAGAKLESRLLSAGAGALSGVHGGLAALKEGAAKLLKGKTVEGLGFGVKETPTLDAWAQDSRDAQNDLLATAKDTSDFADTVDALPQDEVAALHGRYGGRTGGSIGQLATPTGAAMGLRKLGSVALQTPTGQRAAKAGGDAIDLIKEEGINPVVNAVRQKVMVPVARGLGEHAPTRFGIEDPTGRMVGEAAETVGRTAPQYLEQKVRDATQEVMRPIMEKYGVTDPKAQAALSREILDQWGSEAGRRGADALHSDLFDALQPLHRQIYDVTGLAEKGVPYNPLHPLWGQNPSRAAMMTETAAARALEAEGKDVWQATDIADAHTLPGVRRLPAGSYEAKGMRPLSEVAENTVNRMKGVGGGVLSRYSPSEIEETARQFKEMTLPEAFGRTARKLGESAGVSQRSAAKEVVASLPELMKAEPHRYMTWDTLTQKVAQEGGDVGVHAGRTAQGAARAGDAVTTQSTEAYLQANDLKVLRYRPAPPDPLRLPRSAAPGVKALEQGPSTPMGRGAWSRFDVQAPLPEMDGMVVDRHFADAVVDMASPNAARQRAKTWAHAMDSALGLAQAKRGITAGIPGFEMRVNTGDLMRHGMSEGAAGLDPELRKLVADVSNAMPGSAAEKQVVSVGNWQGTLGELRDILNRYGDVHRNFAKDVGREAMTTPGAGRALENAAPRVGKVFNAAADAMAAPGLASGELADQGFRDMFRVGGAQLNEGYRAGEGIRMLNMLSQMKRGVDPRVAGANMRRIMVDFGNTNAAQERLRPVIPFIKFWSQGMQGAFEIAKTNPRGFSRMADMARIMESADQSRRGGAMDPRTKEWQDTLGMRPRVTESGRPTTVRLENPYQDVVDIAEGLYNTVGGGQGPGAGQFLGPTWTRGYGFATGKDASTGRPLLPGADKNEQLRMGDGPLYSQMYQMWKDGMLSTQDMLYFAAKNTPGMPVVAGPADLGARVGLGLGGSAAARLPEDSAGALARAVPNMLTGVRLRRTDPQATGLVKLMRAAGKIPQPVPKADAERKKRGKSPSQQGAR